MPKPAPADTTELSTVLADRMAETYAASKERVRQEPQNGDRLNDAIGAVAHHAPLYMRMPIPAWPPRLLLRKIVRRLILPFWMPQVEFNETVRNALIEVRRQLDESRAAQTEGEQRIAALTAEVAALTDRIEDLTRRSPQQVTTGVYAPNEPSDTISEPDPIRRIDARLADAPEAGALTDFAFRRVIGGRTATGRRSVAFLSPFPPLQSGVADYSEEIVAPLTAFYDLDLFTSDGVTTRLPPGFPPARGYTALERALRSETTNRPYELLIYQFGNNSAYHAEMYAVLLRYAGIVVLHDYVLTHLLLGMHYDRQDLGVSLQAEMAHHAGAGRAADWMARVGRGELRPEDLIAERQHLTRRVFTRSLGIIVHNQWSYDMAMEEHAGDNPLIALIPPVMPPVLLDDTPESIAALRRKYGVPVDAFVFAPCGIVTDAKRPLQILDAFRALLPEKPNAHLVFIGSVNLIPPTDFAAEIAKRSLTDKVTISGYVDIPTFNEYLRLSDVCVTLRYPSAGETSGALLRMLVHGKPSIVTAIGSFANFPDDTVHKLPIPEGMRYDDEVAMVREAFVRLATDTEYRDGLSERGAAYIRREHSPERCARLYAEFGEAVLRHPLTRAKLLSDYAARETARAADAPGSPLAARSADALFADWSRQIAAACNGANG